MKNFLFSFTFISILLISGCRNKINFGDSKQTQERGTTIETLQSIVLDNEYCSNDSKMFVKIAILGSSTKNNGNIEYYLVSNGEGFKIDERGNLSDTCGFGNIPTTIELDKNENLVRYEIAKDGSEYTSSTKNMFSSDAFKIWQDAKYVFTEEKPLLQQAEEYFDVKIMPEGATNSECKFCDKLRYYDPTPESDEKLNETGDLHFNYTTKDNGKNTIYFSSDGSFEAKGSRDEGTGTRTFGQDENTIIVLNNNINHVYDRYIITNQTEDSLNTILEIIQRR